MGNPKHWFSNISLRDVFAVLMFAFGCGGWIAQQRFAAGDYDRQLKDLRSDVEKLERRADEKDKSDNQADKVIGMLEYRLGQIEGKLTSIDKNMQKMAQ